MLEDSRHKDSLYSNLELPPQVECGEAGELVDHGGDVDQPVVPTVQHTQVLKHHHSDILKMTFQSRCSDTWRLASWSGKLVITFSDRLRVDRFTRDPISGGKLASLQ